MAFPHAQSTVFSSDPSMFEQVLPLLHVFVDMSQYKPEPYEQLVVPQKHGEALDNVPPVLAHVGAEIHMQLFPLPWFNGTGRHELKTIFALKYRSPLLVITQPLGKFESYSVDADVSLNPILTAAASHDTLSSILRISSVPTLQNPLVIRVSPIFG